MKKLIIVTFLSLFSLLGESPPIKTLIIEAKPCFKPLERLWTVSGTVESLNDNHALNRLEMAYGVVQIRPIRIKDYNRRNKTHYKMRDCFDPKISKKIYNYYASKFYPTDYEAIAKSWNGRGKSNKVYWAKIKSELSHNIKDN